MDRYDEEYPEFATAAESETDEASDPYSDSAPSDYDTIGGSDLVAITTDLLSTQLRVRPVPTLLAAVAAGWLLGKILR